MPSKEAGIGCIHVSKVFKIFVVTSALKEERKMSVRRSFIKGERFKRDYAAKLESSFTKHSITLIWWLVKRVSGVSKRSKLFRFLKSSWVFRKEFCRSEKTMDQGCRRRNSNNAYAHTSNRRRVFQIYIERMIDHNIDLNNVVVHIFVDVSAKSQFGFLELRGSIADIRDRRSFQSIAPIISCGRRYHLDHLFSVGNSRERKRGSAHTKKWLEEEKKGEKRRREDKRIKEQRCIDQLFFSYERRSDEINFVDFKKGESVEGRFGVGSLFFHSKGRRIHCYRSLKPRDCGGWILG